jgi:hypothetical protein
MKLTESMLRRLIREELEQAMEGGATEIKLGDMNQIKYDNRKKETEAGAGEAREQAEAKFKSNHPQGINGMAIANPDESGWNPNKDQIVFQGMYGGHYYYKTSKTNKYFKTPADA